MSSNMKKGLSLLSTLAVAFVMCLGIMWLCSTSAYAAEGDPDLIVTYGDQNTEFFYDADQGKLYKLDGEDKVYINNETVDLYTAIKNTGVADNVTNASGPEVLDLLAAAGIDYTTLDKHRITFIGNDEYDASFMWADLFGTVRYAFPNANRSAAEGDQGAAVTASEVEGAVEVPVILNFNASKDGPQLSYGQVSPNERNKPNWASKMMGTDKTTAEIVIEAIDSFEQLPNVTDANATVPTGSKVCVGDVIGFGGEEKASPYNGTIYYTTDGTEPDQFSAIYNWDTYKKDGFNYNPFTVAEKGDLIIKTVEYKYGYVPSEVKTFNYTVADPDLIVTYKDQSKSFLYDTDAEKLCTTTGEAIDNVDVSLYSAIKNTGVADNVTNASGPEVLDLLAAAGIDYTTLDKHRITFIGNDEYDASFMWADLFGTVRYAFPNANRSAAEGDQGAAVTAAEKEGAVEVPVILNFKASKDGPQLSYGQVSPNERNKPSWASKMMGTDKTTAKIVIEDVESFEQLPNVTDENVTVPTGSRVAVGDVIGFGGEEKASPYNGTIYYTTDGTEPDQFSAIYNWDTYKKDNFNYNPFTVAEKGDLVIKTVEYKYGYEPSEVKTFTYTTLTDLAKFGGMTLNKATVVAGTKPAVKVVADGKTLIANTHYTLSIGSTSKVGTVSAKVTGIGDYKGALMKNFKVIPAKAKIKSVKKSKKKATVTIVSQKASGVTKYQIAYKKTSDKKWKTTTTTSTKKVIKKLKKGKKYNFKVRAYGKTGYGAYSAVKTVKIK